jgi:hypothetical protein
LSCACAVLEPNQIRGVPGIDVNKVRRSISAAPKSLTERYLDALGRLKVVGCGLL